MKLEKKFFEIPLNEVVESEIFALMSVNPIFYYKNGIREDTIVGFKFLVADPETFINYEIKVGADTEAEVEKLSKIKEYFDSSKERIWVKFDNAIVIPYSMQFGKMECSITASEIKIAKK